MNGVGWSSSMVVHDFHDQDSGDSELRGQRHSIPSFILRRFLPSPEEVANNPWMVYDQNQMLAVVSDPESLTLYHTDTREIGFHHFSQTFGAQDIYSAFTESLTQQSIISGQEPRKLTTLKRVDREIYHGLVDPVWQIMYNHENRTGMIQLDRSDIYNFRKHLHLLTSLARKGDTMHLLANNALMEDARVRRRKFKDQRGMDHVRDVWLHNSEQILDTAHRDVLKNPNIFDLDREDYRANALERYVVFWEAGPGEEFLLTDSSFGGFEGGEIGAKKNSSVDMSPRELEMHIYSKDTMWHQIYVLSPTLAVALCHPTLMHPELTKMQRRRWGLRRSLLEDLPHDLPNKYYKDMKKSEMSFAKDNWHLPVEVEKAFGGKGYDPRRNDDKIVFPVHQLSSQQVALVNSVMLHNQQFGPKIKSVCVRPSSIPSAPYRSLYNALTQFNSNPWRKYSEEQQNEYQPLMDKLEQFLQPVSPQLGPQANYSYQPMYPNHFDPSGAAYSITTEQYLDPASHLRAHATSNHSSITSSFTPSSQSSYSYSSASSQSSTSTKTTSIDTPRFDPKDLRINNKEEKTARREQKASGASQRSSEASGKTQRSKSEKSQPAPSLNITIEQSLPIDGTNSSASGGVPIFRGREPEVRYDPPSGKSSKKSSPNPSRAELDTSNRQRYAEPTGPHHMPPPNRTSVLPDRPTYIETSRPSLPSRARTEPQTLPSISNGNRVPNYGVPSGMEQYMEVPQPQPMQPRRSRSPERHHAPENPQPPRRVNRSPERPVQQQRPQAQRVATAPAARYEPPSVHLDARGRQYEAIQHLEHQRSAELRPQQPKAQRPAAAAYEERAKQVVNSVPERLHQIVNSDLPPPPQVFQRQNRSPERKPEPQRSVPARETVNGHIYDIVSGGQQSLHPQEPQQQMAPAPAQHQPQSYMQPNNVPSGVSSRNTSASAEHPVRPGVEIVRGRPRDAPAPQQQQQQQQPQPPPVPQHQAQAAPAPAPPAKLPPPPVIVEKIIPRPSVPAPESVPAPAVNPVIKQLRFETPPRTKLNHKNSDMSIAGSMMVEVGDSPGGQNALTRYQQPMSDDESTSESGSSDEDDGEGSWEDEGWAEAEEIAKNIPKRPTVRFADKPLRSPVRPKVIESAAARRGVEIERPSSRLGRRVEIPRPLSRNGHSRFERFESRKQKQTGLHQQFAAPPAMRRF